MKKLLVLQAILCLYEAGIIAQPANEFITGTVVEKSEGQVLPVPGAHVYWSGTNVGTVTDPFGYFSLEKSNETPFLVVRFVGYAPDTVNVGSKNSLEITLDKFVELQSVEVVKHKKTTELSMIDPIKVEHVGEGELTKAACCNLSESFETNPSVDVSFTDAITGTKQIQMLGLAGPYTQITRENIPDIRGLSAIYGMEYIPGPWIESIQLNKGTGSVANGFESIAGQINVELRKPETADRLYLNVFASEESRIEANLNLSQKLNDKWSTGLLIHGRNQSMAMDKNNDGFIDKPTGSQLIVLNRWMYQSLNGWQSQLGIKATLNESVGGQIGFDPEVKEGFWGMEMKTNRLEGWLKAGKVSKSKTYQSFGFQLSGSAHNQESRFGLKEYSGIQQSFYGNFIFQSIISDTRHSYRTGASIQYDNYDELFDSTIYDRLETVPGAFFEYTFSPDEKFDLVTGIRIDYHNQYGLFFTPRMHLRYAPTDNLVFRLSAGRGQRTASIFAENNSVLASSRRIVIMSDGSKKPYGLDAESAWNFGANITQKFRLDYRDGAISFDFYHTLFNNQVVVDLDENPQEVLFYNLDGQSFASSFQSQFDYELIRRLDIRMAYRFYDVQTSYQSGMKSKPLVSKHRAFMNLSYGTRDHWKFDATWQWYGPKRIPSTDANPVEYQLAENSPAFSIINTQISKEWREKFELYLGVENALNFKQKNPILSSDAPFSPYFDSSLIWGPVFGRMVYGGMRLKIK